MMMDFFDKLGAYDIILASRSPRRKALLKDAGIPFRALARPINEAFDDKLPPPAIVTRLSQAKARRFERELIHERTIVIAADTIVVSQGEILNKPANDPEAVLMLEKLSGRSHEVYTGVCLCMGESMKSFVEKSLVTFTDLGREEILHYIDVYKPHDKAGAYGIQEWIGLIGIARIEGSYTNVVGLPVHRVYTALKDLIIQQGQNKKE